jgi:hypothetical protein
VGFVEVFRVDDNDDDEPPVDAPRVEPPEWFGPRDDELGVHVSLNAIVGRSDQGVVALSHAVVHSKGLMFELLAQARGLRGAQPNQIFHEQHLWQIDPDELPDGFLRIGVELPDGTRVSNLAGRRNLDFETRPPGSVLVQAGGGGGQSGEGFATIRPGFWLWPLPEPGPLRLSVEWPVVEIPLSTVELDGSELRAAAGRVLPLR